MVGTQRKRRSRSPDAEDGRINGWIQRPLSLCVLSELCVSAAYRRPVRAIQSARHPEEQEQASTRLDTGLDGFSTPEKRGPEPEAGAPPTAAWNRRNGSGTRPLTGVRQPRNFRSG